MYIQWVEKEIVGTAILATIIIYQLASPLSRLGRVDRMTLGSLCVYRAIL